MAGFDVIEMLNGNSIQAAGARKWYQETNYEDAKEIIRDELGNIRNSFVKVGYFLRRIKETEGYQEDGYETIWDCAKDQFRITETTASRWMELTSVSKERDTVHIWRKNIKGITRASYRRCCYLGEKLEEVDPGMTTMKSEAAGKEPEKEKTQVSAETHREEREEEDETPGQMREEDYLEESEEVDTPDITDEKTSEIQRIVEEERQRQDRENPDPGRQDTKEKASIREQKTESILDTETKEEDETYARKLHVLKMLEKYYIYLNEEEIEILKGMVQDCKRRKQEYALEDCGTTS